MLEYNTNKQRFEITDFSASLHEVEEFIAGLFLNTDSIKIYTDTDKVREVLKETGRGFIQSTKLTEDDEPLEKITLFYPFNKSVTFININNE